MASLARELKQPWFYHVESQSDVRVKFTHVKRPRCRLCGVMCGIALCAVQFLHFLVFSLLGIPRQGPGEGARVRDLADGRGPDAARTAVGARTIKIMIALFGPWIGRPSTRAPAGTGSVRNS